MRGAAGFLSLLVCTVVLGTGAHAVVHGCLPAPDSLRWLLPLATGSVALSQALLRHRRLGTRVAGAQATLHLCLAAAAACGGPHGSAVAERHASSAGTFATATAMLLAHAAAAGVCLRAYERVRSTFERLLEPAARALAAALGRLRGGVPCRTRVPLLVGDGQVRPTSAVLAASRTRGPPAAAL